MARIAVLPDSIANKIAAGEVVERPASALKELVENSIDAGARSIDVSLQAGGRDAIIVTDDGEGMGPDDILLALERHATSKIHSADDIEHVGTLGFRGEAVPSIASVSQFRLTSRDPASDAATSVEVRGGKIVSVTQEPSPRGTRVEVLALFHNAPARRKFLRAAETEKQRSAEVLSRFAIAYPRIRFRLETDGRLVFDYAPVESPFERCAQVFGRQFTDKLLPVDARERDLSLTGLCSGLGETRSHTRDQHLFVNRRPVRDKLLSHALSAAYWEALPRGRRPVVILLLSVPPELVDVNVHPTKAEVRFRRPGDVHGFLVSALQRALRESGVEPSLGAGRFAPAAGSDGDPELGVAKGIALRTAGGGSGIPSAVHAGAARDRAWPAGSEGHREGGDPFGLRVSELPLPSAGGIVWSPGRVPAPARMSAGSAGGAGQEWSFTPEAASPGATPETEPRSRARLVPLGQFLDSYILASEGGSLLLVDQHAAHERILFEGLRRRASEAGGHAPGQGLLTPITIELGQAEAMGLEDSAAALCEAGFEIETFGERTLLLRALPAALGDADPEQLVREILSDLREEASQAVPDERARRAAASAACHAAIKVRFPLTTEKMAWLLGELLRCETPTTCPHGRPAILRLTLEEIERGFHRR